MSLCGEARVVVLRNVRTFNCVDLDPLFCAEVSEEETRFDCVIEAHQTRVVDVGDLFWCNMGRFVLLRLLTQVIRL